MCPSSPTPQDTPITAEQLLDAARACLRRLTPHEAWAALRRDAQLIDIRSDSQRARGGVIPGVRFIPRNVLEWRLDPTSPDRIAEAGDPERRVVLVCNDGYASSLAVPTLRRLGLRRATDLDGGYRAWRATTPAG